MAERCIPSNPDISGIGVRTAIYVQNFLCFAPVVVHLWDGIVTNEELRGIKDQTFGMLAIAFAILISTIIGAKSPGGQTQAVTGFHAAIILELSWMNNTSTWIWFLLFVHHKSKAPVKEMVKATFTAWFLELRSMMTGESIVKRMWRLITRAPVLTVGSIHLSLMAAVGLWLWSDPLRFGESIPCNPSLTVVGGDVDLSSTPLRIFSLMMYSLLAIPGVNLLLPFSFFLVLHISYNAFRRHYQKHPEIPLFENAPPAVYTGFLIVGLISLVIINILLLVDIELTLVRNKQLLSLGDNEWGFGQILALLLLVIPVRDFITSWRAINRLRRERQEATRDAWRPKVLAPWPRSEQLQRVETEDSTRWDGMCRGMAEPEAQSRAVHPDDPPAPVPPIVLYFR